MTSEDFINSDGQEVSPDVFLTLLTVEALETLNRHMALVEQELIPLGNFFNLEVSWRAPCYFLQTDHGQRNPALSTMVQGMVQQALDGKKGYGLMPYLVPGEESDVAGYKLCELSTSSSYTTLVSFRSTCLEFYQQNETHSDLLTVDIPYTYIRQLCT